MSDTKDSSESPPLRSRGRDRSHAPKQKTQITKAQETSQAAASQGAASQAAASQLAASQGAASQGAASQAAASQATPSLASPSTQPSQGSAPTQSTEKSHKTFKLKRGALKVIGYTKDDPMTIKMKVTLPSGEDKLVCK